ncbi:hypothetical protein GCM10007939_17980 [Amylibacter marinus]|uniref:VOC domain-containing protein n=1 Tax=Amylibacter marinus TaxID=1475483 RepID=A0ABQ5VW64_9RHOB|nr:VOC family protein [Amylibacter marinus]GLQ35515.1 hypothetical protein GCM10007939_17980 [Amylibacter marinus]
MSQGHRSMPILSVRDVLKSVEFFECLGFSSAGHWNNDDGTVNFSIIVLDDITLGLMRDVDARGTGENWAAYLYVADIDALADHAQANNVVLAREIVDQFYGCRDFEIIDPDGNRLCIGQDQTPGERGPGL